MITETAKITEIEPDVYDLGGRGMAKVEPDGQCGMTHAAVVGGKRFYGRSINEALSAAYYGTMVE